MSEVPKYVSEEARNLMSQRQSNEENPKFGELSNKAVMAKESGKDIAQKQETLLKKAETLKKQAKEKTLRGEKAKKIEQNWSQISKDLKEKKEKDFFKNMNSEEAEAERQVELKAKKEAEEITEIGEIKAKKAEKDEEIKAKLKKIQKKTKYQKSKLENLRDIPARLKETEKIKAQELREEIAEMPKKQSTTNNELKQEPVLTKEEKEQFFERHLAESQKTWNELKDEKEEILQIKAPKSKGMWGRLKKLNPFAGKIKVMGKLPEIFNPSASNPVEGLELNEKSLEKIKQKLTSDDQEKIKKYQEKVAKLRQDSADITSRAYHRINYNNR
jgi:hypothetical protein